MDDLSSGGSLEVEGSEVWSNERLALMGRP